MNLLVNGKLIVLYAPKVEFGIFDEPFEKWKLSDENGDIICYAIDNNYTLVEDVELPSDYADGKYYFENGEFVLNENWKPFVSTEDRIATLEENVVMLQEENIASAEMEAELLYELSLLQLGIE